MLSGSLIHYTRVGPAGCSGRHRGHRGGMDHPLLRSSLFLPLDSGIHRVCGAIPNTFMDQIERFQLRRNNSFLFSSPLSLLVLLAVVVVSYIILALWRKRNRKKPPPAVRKNPPATGTSPETGATSDQSRGSAHGSSSVSPGPVTTAVRTPSIRRRSYTSKVFGHGGLCALHRPRWCTRGLALRRRLPRHHRPRTGSPSAPRWCAAARRQELRR